eukprot:1231661-Amphidinium_carterae.1
MLTFTDARNQMYGASLKRLDSAELRCDMVATMRFEDLPLLPLADVTKKTTALSHFVEVIKELVEKPDLSTMLDAPPHELPAHLAFRREITGLVYQYYAVPQVDGTFWFIKHIYCVQRVCIQHVRQAAVGAVYVANLKEFGCARWQGMLIQFVLGRLGGDGVVRFMVVKAEPKKRGQQPDLMKTPEEIEAGFGYIANRAPRSTANNEHLKWIELQKADLASPVHGWRDALLKECILNLVAGRSLSTDINDYPLTLADLSNWALTQLAFPCLQDFKTKGLLWIGKAGRGKTPAAYAIANTLSGYWISKDETVKNEGIRPHFRTTCHIDFLRGQAGNKLCPYIYDDGKMEKEEACTLKAFFDVSAEDAKAWARWGASAFAKSQMRQACSNGYHAYAEPSDMELVDAVELSHAAFVDMVTPTFGKSMHKEDLMAIFKRCNIIVLGVKAVYLRRACEDEVPVRIVKYVKDVELLGLPCRQELNKYKAGEDINQNIFERNLQWSLKFLDS